MKLSGYGSKCRVFVPGVLDLLSVGKITHLIKVCFDVKLNTLFTLSNPNIALLNPHDSMVGHDKCFI